MQAHKLLSSTLIALSALAFAACNAEPDQRIASEHFGFGEGDNPCLSDALQLTITDAQGATTTAWVCEDGATDYAASTDPDLLELYTHWYAYDSFYDEVYLSCPDPDLLPIIELRAGTNRLHQRCAATLLKDFETPSVADEYVQCYNDLRRRGLNCVKLTEYPDGSPLDVCGDDYMDVVYDCLDETPQEVCSGGEPDSELDDALELIADMFDAVFSVCDPSLRGR